MKAASAIGIGVAVLGLLGGAMMEGTSPVAFLNIPALLVVLGGTTGVCMASTGMAAMKRIPSLYKIVFAGADHDLGGKVVELVRYADRAGRDSLEAEIEGMTARHRHAAEPFDKAGGFAPTMGIIGTVMGLVHVLENLSQPETLGPSISSAFIATLFGVASANVVYYPIAYRLKGLSSVEADGRAMVLEGIMAIQAGDNPRIVTEKLLSFIAPEGRDAAREAVTGPKLQAVPDGAEAAEAEAA